MTEMDYGDGGSSNSITNTPGGEPPDDRVGGANPVVERDGHDLKRCWCNFAWCSANFPFGPGAPTRRRRARPHPPTRAGIRRQVARTPDTALVHVGKLHTDHPPLTVDICRYRQPKSRSVPGNRAVMPRLALYLDGSRGEGVNLRACQSTRRSRPLPAGKEQDEQGSARTSTMAA